MGTRADFYVGRGADAEWLGSIGFDGYPDGVPATNGRAVLVAATEAGFRAAVTGILCACDHATLPSDGWPWPWEDSRTTDYAYALFERESGAGLKVWASYFGHEWFDPLAPQADDEPGEKVVVFPDMKARQKVTFGKRSGLLVIGPKGPVGGSES